MFAKWGRHSPPLINKRGGEFYFVAAASGGHENHCFDHVGDFVFSEVFANVSDEM